MIRPRVTLVSALGARDLNYANEDADYWPPIGVLTLAALIRDSAFVQVLDLDDIWRRCNHVRPLFEEIALSAIQVSAPDILGFSSISGSYPLAIRLADRCARMMPDTAIVFGGPQSSVTDVATMEAFPFIDMILRGEADDSFPALVAALASGAPICSVPGLTFRRRNRVCRNPNGPVILDMDRLPLPAFDLASSNKFSAIPLEIGRGCPFSCTFCSTNDFFRRRFRLKSPAHVLDEMNTLNETFHVSCFNLVHDMFTVDRGRVVEFCETLLAAGAPYRWSCSARTDCVDPELIELMSRAGCHDIFFGIETGSQRMQRIIDKDLDLTVARQVLRKFNGLSVHATASLIIGYPQETESDVRDTVDFFSEAMLMPLVDPQLNVLSPLAATPITEQYRGQLTLDANWTRVSENGTLQDGVDQLLIAAHPEIFPNFYAFPFYTDRAVLRRLRNFLFTGIARCGGLMRAVYLHTRDMLTVFQQWDKVFPDPIDEWVRGPDFAHRLIDFCEAGYADSGSVAATARFYRQVHSQPARPRVRTDSKEAFLALAEDVSIIESSCDINAVLDALENGREPDDVALCSPVTVAIKLLPLNRSDIRRFPDASLDLLRHAQKFSTFREILTDFETRRVSYADLPPQTVALGGIQILEKAGFVRRVLPGRAWDPDQAHGSDNGVASPAFSSAALVRDSSSLPATS